MPATNEGQNTSKRNDQTTTLVIQPHHHSSASTAADSAASTLTNFSNSSTITQKPSGETSNSLSAENDSMEDGLEVSGYAHSRSTAHFGALVKADPDEPSKPPSELTPPRHDLDEETIFKSLETRLQDPVSGPQLYERVRKLLQNTYENRDSKLENLPYDNSKKIAIGQLSLPEEKMVRAKAEGKEALDAVKKDSAASTPSARHCSNTSGFNPGPSYPGPYFAPAPIFGPLNNSVGDPLATPANSWSNCFSWPSYLDTPSFSPGSSYDAGPCYAPVPTFGPLNSSAASYSPEIITVSDSEPDASSALKLPTTSRVYCEEESQIENFYTVKGTREKSIFVLRWDQRDFSIGNRKLLPGKLGLDDAKLRYKDMCKRKWLMEITGRLIKQQQKGVEACKKEPHQSLPTEADNRKKDRRKTLHCLRSAVDHNKKRLEYAAVALELNRVGITLEAEVKLVTNYALNWGITPNTTSSESRNYSWISKPEKPEDLYKKRIEATNTYMLQTTTEFRQGLGIISGGLLKLKSKSKALARKSCKNGEEGFKKSQAVAKLFLYALASGDPKKLEEANEEASKIIYTLPDATGQESWDQLFYQKQHLQCVEQLCRNCDLVDARFSQDNFLRLLKAEMPFATTPSDCDPNPSEMPPAAYLQNTDEEEACSETTTASTSQLGKHLASRGLFRQPPLTKARRIETETVTSNQALPIDLSCGYRSST